MTVVDVYADAIWLGKLRNVYDRRVVENIENKREYIGLKSQSNDYIIDLFPYLLIA